MARAIAAYLACVTFALTFLLATLTGTDGLTAVARGTVVAVLTWYGGRLLAQPVISTILDAMARDRVVRNKTEDAE